jgi:hypothetical protein
MLAVVVKTISDSVPPPAPPPFFGACERCEGVGFKERVVEPYSGPMLAREKKCRVCDGTGLATPEQNEAWRAELSAKQSA